MENQSVKVPKWFWVVAIISLLWNLMGVTTFFQYLFMSDEALSALSVAEQDLFNSYPIWIEIAFAIAVFGGTIGSIGLLIRKKWAKPAFVVSLIGIIPQMTHNLFMTNAWEVQGPGSAVMPVLVVIIGVFLFWFTAFAGRKNWLQ